jgi:lipoprotein-anchoring transpeptidase ErfK/SrfK
MGGQVVLVSLTQQWLWAYQDSRLVMASAVTTGMPQLPTPTGVYHISMKEANVWFYSPWPLGSPYYYTPEHVDYAMLFRSGGFYLHAAAWRHAFGPGTNVPHTNPDGSYETGSHGCVNLPVTAAGALYGWIGIGATVIIVA